MLVWIVFPPNFDATKSTRPCFTAREVLRVLFPSVLIQVEPAADGSKRYIVVAPNRRGLPTFGQAWNAQISGDYGGQNIKDYLSAIDAVKKEPYVDANRLGAVGASYGGYSVLYLAGMHEKRFKAFIAHCGMFNLESQSSGTEEMFFVHHDLGGYYWDKPKPKSYTQFHPSQC